MNRTPSPIKPHEDTKEWKFMRHWKDVSYEEMGISPRVKHQEPEEPSPLGDFDD